MNGLQGAFEVAGDQKIRNARKEDTEQSVNERNAPKLDIAYLESPRLVEELKVQRLRSSVSMFGGV